MKSGSLAKEVVRSSSKGQFRSPARQQAEITKLLAAMNARLDDAERLADKTLAELKAMAKKRQ